jgi:hypothetical protein
MSTSITAESLTASGAAYTLTKAGGLVAPSDWTVVRQSDASYRCRGFSAALAPIVPYSGDCSVDGKRPTW